MNILKKMTLIADVFPKLPTTKNVVRSMCKKSSFIGLFEKQHGKRVQTVLKSERQNLYHIYWSLWRQFSFQMSLLEICKMLTLAADDKYSLLNRDNSTQPIQMQLSQKQKFFRNFFLNVSNLVQILNIL